MPIFILPFFFFFVFISAPFPLLLASEISVSSHPSELRLPPGDRVESSPGSRPGTIVTANRVHIRGLSRLRNLTKFAHSLKIRVSVAEGDALFRIQTIEICLHRNASIGVGMCPSTEWQKLSKGSWIRSVSPFGDWILDIRMLPDPSRLIDVSTEQEFLYHRVLFLVLGLVMMAAARALSESVVFYYGSAMTIGVALVILMVLFQGMKLLPTGRKSSLAIFVYSSIVGVGTFLLRYMSGLLRSALLEIGISEDMLNPLGILLLVCLVLAGAWFGYWGVRRLVLTDDGLVDTGVARFVEWAVLIFGATLIFQSSLDTILAAGELAFAIMITAVMRKHRKLSFLRHFFKRMFKRIGRVHFQIPPTRYTRAEYSHQFQNSETKSTGLRTRRFSPTSSNTPVRGKVEGLTKQQQGSHGEDSYYSTFHNTPDRKRFSKEGWETFTKEHTRKALRELVSSPDFNKWAVANAERISVTPPRVSNQEQKKHFFRWF